jgi:type II secretory pathway component GspD/PulD (secretin)
VFYAWGMKQWFYLFIGLCLGACTEQALHDPSLQKTEEDFWALQKPIEGDEVSECLEDSSFEREDYPEIFFDPISVDFTHDMPAEEILEVLCQTVKIPYLLGQGLEGHLSYHAENRPFLEILTVISESLGFTFSYDNGLLKIERDMPVFKTYPMAFLSLSRESQSSLTNNTQMMEGALKESTSQNGSKQTLETKSTQDFWSELERVLQGMLQAPSSFILQPQANLVHINAPQKIQKKVAAFLESLQKRATQQVLIEAKIIEVTLKEAYQGGIDWAEFSKKNLKARGEFGSLLRSSSPILGQGSGDFFSLNLGAKSFQSVLQFMESFGTVRTLSSPRITVLHNQNAFLRVAENQIFFDVKYERQFLSGDHEHYGSVVASHSRIQSVPIGLVLSVHPVIRSETQEVLLTLRPTISRVVGTREDPSVQLMAEAMRQGGKRVTSEIPIIAVREMDSVLKLKSGKAAILGGLMIEGADHTSNGLPGLRRQPLSFLTSAKRSNRVMTELVIFLTATIVESPRAHTADRRLYENFTKDPRPLMQETEKS